MSEVDSKNNDLLVKRKINEYLGRNKGDGAIKTTAKIVLPIQAIVGSIEDISKSFDDLKKMSPDSNTPTEGTLPFSEAVISPDLDPEVRAFNIKKLRQLSFWLLLASIFILVDCVVFIAAGFYVATFSLFAALMAFIMSGKYAFYADALERGEFTSKSIGRFVLGTKWFVKVLLG